MPRGPWWMLLLIGASVATNTATGDELFEQRIRPLLIARCIGCHGAEKANAGLRVDSREALVEGGDSGPAVVPGNTAESHLLRAVKGVDGFQRMPPDEPLEAAAITDLETWIAGGAVWPEIPASRDAFAAARHWSFVAVRPVTPPELQDPWSDHPIDRFIEAAWREHGLAPVAEADARTLSRRLWLDLIGLPPTPAEVARFAAEYVGPDRDAVFAHEVERLLASAHYGERWGRHWMDLVRYADTAGDNADYPIPEAVRYRDYIIDAFNSDKPYDQFVREQLAGDLLAEPSSPELTAERITATGMIALSRRYATGPYELWHLTIEDTIDTVGKVFLGLTLKCARCHDHKFDPVTTHDYYALYGIFDSTQYPWAGAEEFVSKKLPRKHFVPLLSADEARQVLETHEQSQQHLSTRITALKERLKEMPEAERPSLEAELRGLEMLHLCGHRRGYPADVPCAYAVREAVAHDVPVQIVGDPTQPGPLVPRGAIAFLSQQPLEIPAGASGRRELAEWITRADHPLTARVIVNRLWQHHFGRGLVPTPSNFGTSGAQPTHPELLDYLAARLIDSGWSLKSLHRLILTSRVWRLSSQTDDAMSHSDTGNEFLWRQNRRRLEAEAIRDAMLAVAGTLDLRRPGAHPFPPIDRWNWTQHHHFHERYDSGHRSVYLMTQRLQRHPYLALFDGPDTNTTTDTRTSATVPTQALYLLNSPEMEAIAGNFVKRLLGEQLSDAERIDWAHELCFSRPASEEQLALGQRYLAEAEKKLAVAVDARRLAWLSYARALLVSNAFFFVD